MSLHGDLKMLKHIMLCHKGRRMYCSNKLTLILPKLGYSESHDFGIEMETTRIIDDVSTYITPQNITGEGKVLFHYECDNLNKITTNIHGPNVFNSTGA